MNDREIKERRKKLEAIPRSVITSASDYPDGYSTGLHDHPFAQLVHTTEGVMEVEAEGQLWMIPPGRALWVPSRIPHSVTMHGQARMRTLYVRTGRFQYLPLWVQILNVSPLMKEMLMEPSDDPGFMNQRLMMNDFLR
ncbi:AraC family ligand binding domain-containing protein [Endozoicomonas numazuensis]|uniref:AraC family ligand binding domain-containing protein n=1 Tax=Endozoicomonas numazuensis TaxID=1137799 RepID=UPI000689AE31